MNIQLELFEEWLINKNLKPATINNYIFYFNKFVYPAFTQETVSLFLSNENNRNSNARGFLVNFQKFLKINSTQLGLSDELKERALEVELPKLTGRPKQRLIHPIPHEQIQNLENCLGDEK